MTTPFEDIIAASCAGPDARPAWIGPSRPQIDIDRMEKICKWAQAQYDFYTAFLEFVEGDSPEFLDVGCGTGQCVAMLAQRGRATGVDCHQKAFEFALKYNSGPNITFVRDSFPCKVGGPFDYIFCIETIEHISYAQQAPFIEAMIGLLRNEDSRVFITTPNEQKAAGDHHGIWTKAVYAEREARFRPNLVLAGGVTAGKQELEDTPGTHFAWVLKK